MLSENQNCNKSSKKRKIVAFFGLFKDNESIFLGDLYSMFPLEKVDANSDIQRSHNNKSQSLVLNQNAIKFSDKPKCDKISLVTESSSSQKNSAQQ